jgi:hypothetical protein
MITKKTHHSLKNHNDLGKREYMENKKHRSIRILTSNSAHVSGTH